MKPVRRKHGWIAVLIAGIAASMLLHNWLEAKEKALISHKIAHESTGKLLAAQMMLEQHLDAAAELAAFADFGMPRLPAERALGALLALHRGEVRAAAVFSGAEGESVGNEDGKAMPTLRLAALAKEGKRLLPSLKEVGEGLRLRLVPAQKPGRLHLWIAAAGGALTMLELDAGVLLAKALAQTPAANLEVEVAAAADGGREQVLLRHRPLLSRTADGGARRYDWSGAFEVGGMRFFVRTRATDALLQELSSRAPMLELVLGLLASALAAWSVFSHNHQEFRLQEMVREQTRQISEERRMLASIFKEAGEGILIIGADGIIEHANPAACRMFGYAQGELVGKNVQNLVPKEVREEHARWMAQPDKFLDVMNQEREIRGQRRDGSIFPCRITLAKIGEEDERISAVIHDLSAEVQQRWMQYALLRLHAEGEGPQPFGERLARMLAVFEGDPWGAFGGKAALFLARGDRMMLEACRGWSDEEQRRYADLPLGEGLCGEAVAMRKVAFCNGWLEKRGWAGSGSSEAGYWCVPLLRGSNLLGLLHLRLHEGKKPPQELVAFMREAGQTIVDILERERALTALAASEERHRMLVEASPLGIMIVQHGRIRYANPAVIRLLGAKRMADILERPLTDFAVEGDAEAVDWESVPTDKEAWEIRLRRLDGTDVWIEAHAASVRFAGQEAVQLLLADITRRKQAEERLSYLSFFDDLTGLANRRLFADRLGLALARASRRKENLAILYLDLDRFKFVNDSLGHDAGDLVLKEAAARLRQTLRATDTVARMGGDEFAVLLPEGNADTAMAVARKIHEAFGAAMHVRGHELLMQASIGIAVFPQDGEDISTLIKHADTAMYHAKQQRARIHYFSNEMEKRAERKLAMEQALAKAVDEGGFELHFQPQLLLKEQGPLASERKAEQRLPLHFQTKMQIQGDGEIQPGRVIGVESLIRWFHPKLGLVSPAEFIPMAEETGMIRPLTHWVLVEAARQAVEWEAAGIRPERIGVNISAVQLMQKGLAEEINRCVIEAGAKPEWLEIEITETAAMRDPKTAAAIMDALVAAGFSIAIDDFGTGYSSLSYLKRLPAEWLKIDTSFVRGLPGSSSDQAIVRSVIAMAHALGMKVVAEGVETQAQLDFLIEEGCDAVQGFLFSKPLPKDAVTRFLKEHQAVRSEM